MSTKAASPERKAASMPVTIGEELPDLTADERRELAASLAEAETRIEAGDFAEYEPRAFRDRLQRLYREARHAKDA